MADGTSTKYIWKYITRKEFACPCCGKLPPDFYFEDGREVYSPPEIYIGFFKVIEEIRRRWGKPIPFHFYRCPPYNKKIGGELHSVHMFGLADDMDVESTKEVDELSWLIEQSGLEVRMGIYKKPKIKIIDGKRIEIPQSFVHVDQGFKIHPRLSPEWYVGRRWWK